MSIDLSTRLKTYGWTRDEADAIAAGEGAEAAVRAVATIVQDAIAGNLAPAAVYPVLGWAVDTVWSGLSSEEASASVATCIPDLLMPTLREALVAPYYALRRHALQAFGKLGSKLITCDAPVLLGLVDRYLDEDPLLSPELAWQISLVGGDDGPVIASIRKHRHYLTRWSFFGTHRGRPGSLSPAEQQKLHACCTDLMRDEASVVRAEARFVLAKMGLEVAFSAERPAERGQGDDRANQAYDGRAAKRERKRRSDELEATRPSLLFDSLAGPFFAELGLLDYDVEELDRFVRRASTPVEE